MNSILIYRNNELIEMPKKATSGSAGYDVYSIDNVNIAPGEIVMMPTGIHMVIPDGYECQVRPRSSLAVKHGITIINSPSTIDSDYRGEVKIPLINHGKETVTLLRGDRIAQFVFVKLADLNVEEITKESFEEFETDRGTGGFGSTGK